MDKTALNTEEEILKAAQIVFKRKGYDGASVQDIATEAGTTKSMLNYYFRSKEKLFFEIFHREFVQLISGLVTFISSDLPLKEKIEKIVDLDTDRLLQFPDLPIFILNEINRNPEIVFKNIENFPVQQMIMGLTQQINAEFESGLIKKTSARELMLNIQSLTIFPFAAKPMLMKIHNMDEIGFKNMIINRKLEVAELIWNSIKIDAKVK